MGPMEEPKAAKCLETTCIEMVNKGAWRLAHQVLSHPSTLVSPNFRNILETPMHEWLVHSIGLLYVWITKTGTWQCACDGQGTAHLNMQNLACLKTPYKKHLDIKIYQQTSGVRHICTWRKAGLCSVFVRSGEQHIPTRCSVGLKTSRNNIGASNTYRNIHCASELD